MALKENFLNDIFEGNRKYQITKNEDGTYTILDVTEYTQEGDLFGAGDINATNAAVNAHISAKNNPHGVTAEQVGARPDTWMPTAEQVGARSDTWMPTAKQVGTMVVNNISGLDLNTITYPFMGYASDCKNRPIESNGYLEVVTDYGERICLQRYTLYVGMTYERQLDVNGVWSTWTTKFLPLAGGTLYDTLRVDQRDGYIAEIHSYNGDVYLRSTNSSRNDYADLMVGHNSEPVYVRSKSNGEYRAYALYGQHNITCGTSDITAGASSLATGCYYDVYE